MTREQNENDHWDKAGIIGLTANLWRWTSSRADPSIRRIYLILMARETGLEPATSGVTGRRSNQLSYSPAFASNSRARGAG